MTRLMGVDYGTKRVGVAISDEAGQFALPLSVLKNSPDLLPELVGLAKDNAVEEIVIGDSRQYDMSANKIQPAIMEFKKALEGKGLKVSMELEFMTSVQAERFQGKNDKTDASAAALILQSYLDRKNTK